MPWAGKGGASPEVSREATHLQEGAGPQPRPDAVVFGDADSEGRGRDGFRAGHPLGQVLMKRWKGSRVETMRKSCGLQVRRQMAVNMVRNGQIQDAYSLALFYFFLLKRLPGVLYKYRI